MSLTLSEFIKRRNAFANKAGAGFYPRVIILTREDYEALKSEIKELLRDTFIYPHDDSLVIAGIKVVTETQALVIK